MVFKNKNLTPKQRYELIGKLIEEIKLRKYSYRTGKSYIYVVKNFLRSELPPIDFDREIIHIKIVKGDKERVVFYILNLRKLSSSMGLENMALCLPRRKVKSIGIKLYKLLSSRQQEGRG